MRSKWRRTEVLIWTFCFAAIFMHLNASTVAGVEESGQKIPVSKFVEVYNHSESYDVMVYQLLVECQVVGTDTTARETIYSGITIDPETSEKVYFSHTCNLIQINGKMIGPFMEKDKIDAVDSYWLGDWCFSEQKTQIECDPSDTHENYVDVVMYWNVENNEFKWSAK